MTAKLAKKIGCGKQKVKFFIVREGLRRCAGDEMEEKLQGLISFVTMCVFFC